MSNRALIFGLILVAACFFAMGYFLRVLQQKSIDAERVIDRSAEIRDSTTIADLEAARIIQDSIIAAQALEIANRTPTYIRLDHATRTLTLASDDSIGAILDGKPVSKY